MVDCLSSIHDALGLVLALHKLGLVAQDCNTNTKEAKKKKKKKGQKFKVTVRNRVSTRPALGYVRTLTSH